ncbi:MAG TPA: radical SAM protein [Dehalococcoidales bacterium]|nr:radical SAM protein [Dehalococcoidales bacterium]
MFSVVQTETTNYCNAHCLFCVHDRIKPLQHMAEPLYRKIVEDAAQYPLEGFTAMMNGEPFMDPDIMPRLRFARQTLQKQTILRIFTNASIITKEQIDELAGMGNVLLSVSLNGSTAEIRQTMMGLDDFNAVKDKIDYIHQKGILQQVSTVWFPNLSIDEINALAQFPKACVFVMNNWAGELYPYRRIKPTNCTRISGIVGVLADGRVPLCCFDPFCKVLWGNMNTMTLQEIWDGAEHQKYLRYHNEKRGQELPLCRNCTQG